MRMLAMLLLAALETSCTTLANRRDLYSPSPSPEIQRPQTTTATTSATTVRSEEVTAPPTQQARP
ncbi:MAG: hypothetical protein JO354_13155 [Verrucomicrobia bacterium]|nr:hypothetical protein [Verrucomicrobiota bacterium]